MTLSLQDVELRHLNALRAVAEEGTFGRAAERLGYTQSAVSQQIAMLEKLVGGSLFERRGGPRPVEITPLGRRVLAHASSVLDRLAAAEADLALYLAGQVGTLSVGTFQSVSVQILPRVLRLLRQERPDLEVRLDEAEDEPQLIHSLRTRRLDAVFVARQEPDDEIDVVSFLEDPFVLLSPRHRTAPELVDRCVSPADLEGEPLVAETATACAVQVEADLRRHGVEPNIVFRTQDNAAVQAMVRSGLGHAVMPVLAVDPNDPDVVVRRLDPPLAPRRIGVATLRDVHQPAAVAGLVEITGRVCEELVDRFDLLTPVRDQISAER